MRDSLGAEVTVYEEDDDKDDEDRDNYNGNLRRPQLALELLSRSIVKIGEGLTKIGLTITTVLLLLPESLLWSRLPKEVSHPDATGNRILFANARRRSCKMVVCESVWTDVRRRIPEFMWRSG